MPLSSRTRYLSAAGCIVFSGVMLAVVHNFRGSWGGNIRPPLWALVCVLLACAGIGAGAVLLFIRSWLDGGENRISTFSLSRVLLATAVCAAALSGARDLGMDGAALGLLAAIPICAIALVARPKDVLPIARTAVACGIGMLVANLLTPRDTPAYRNGADYWNMLAGAIVGWLIGAAVMQIVRKRRMNRPAIQESAP